MNSVYVIRWDRKETYGADFLQVIEYTGRQFIYIAELRLGARARGCYYVPTPEHAIKFSSWAEAAAVAAFIIHHIDEKFEDALEVVKIDL